VGPSLDESNVLVNDWVLARWYASAVEGQAQGEASIFSDYCASQTRLRPAPQACALYREVMVLSADAVRQMHYIDAFDAEQLRRGLMPTNNWMRDENMGGLLQLSQSADQPDIFAWLHARSLFASVLAEKANATALFDSIESKSRQLLAMQQSGRSGASAAGDSARGVIFARQLVASAQYGAMLSRIVHGAFQVMVAGYVCDQQGGHPQCYQQGELVEALLAYDSAWARATALHAGSPFCASLYVDYYRSGHAPPVDGIGATVAKYRNLSRW
jgi:hypothetical protein